MEQVNLQQGIQRAIQIIERVDERPIMVAVYGWPNSGKSFLINTLGDYFEPRGIETARYGCGPHRETFEEARDRPRFLKDLLLFHCGWIRNNDSPSYENFFGHEDPNSLAESLGRKIHANIGIYNPNFYRFPKGNYDLIICNPDSVRKPDLF